MPGYAPRPFLSLQSQPTPSPWLPIPSPPLPALPQHHRRRHPFFHPHHSSGNTQKEIITVGGLVVMIILCSILMLWGGRYNRQPHHHHNRNDMGNHGVEISGMTIRDQEEASQTEQATGGSKETALPPVVYHKRTKSANCAVCLEALDDGDECRVVPACNHVYHLACIDQWLKNNAKCPLCRSNVWERV